TRSLRDWSADVCSSDLDGIGMPEIAVTASPAFLQAHPFCAALLSSVAGVGLLRFASHELVALGSAHLLQRVGFSTAADRAPMRSSVRAHARRSSGEQSEARASRRTAPHRRPGSETATGSGGPWPRCRLR